MEPVAAETFEPGKVRALLRGEVADGQHCRSDETKRLSRCRPVVWMKKREVDPIAQYLNPFGGDAELDEPLPQPA